MSGPAIQPTNQPTTPAPATSAAPPAQPTSFASGRYQVQKFLGEGGKKKVYLAHDTTLDREVAFALIKTEGLDDTSRTRIQREAQAMGRLGSHPHIVTVFDLGEEQSQPSMVTELMGGGDVEGLIENATDHRLPLERAIKIAQEVLATADVTLSFDSQTNETSLSPIHSADFTEPASVIHLSLNSAD